jgi:hypothetical protein
VRVLDDAVERKERAIVGGDRIIITYDEKTSTWRRITRLCRRPPALLALSLVLEPEVMGPDGPKPVTQGLLDLSVT